MPVPDNKRTPGINHLLLFGLGLLGFLALEYVLQRASVTEAVSYSQFETMVAHGQVKSVEIGPNTIEGSLKRPLAGGQTRFITDRVDPQLASELETNGVEVSGVPANDWITTLLSWIVPVLAFSLAWYFLFRPGLGGRGIGELTAIGKAHAKIYVEKDTKVTFADVAGVDEAKFELREVVSFLADPKSYGRLGARVPKGILLVGPPGTGKTLLARAVAGEARVPFFSITGSEFVEMFVGVGAARVRDLFAQARKVAPAIIFIDELDALGRSRVANSIGGFDEKEQTLNQLLAELDGFDPSSGVILLAATNRPEILDPALLRAGRFDRQVLVDRPDLNGRLAILRIHAAKIRLNTGVELEKIAGMTTGFTGADIANMVNEAAISATRRNAAAVDFADFTTAIERIVAGIEKKSRVLSKEERRRVAYHEMGHALVASSLPGVDPVQKVSIIPRGVGALGYTMQRPTEDRFLLAASELRNRVAVLMGGRAAEQLVFNGNISTGAADDLQRATEIAVEMVTKYGMDSTLGQRTYMPQTRGFLPAAQDQVFNASEATSREIDLAVRELLEKGAATARAILERRRADLEAGAALLLSKESLTAEEFAPLRGLANAA
jgi:cell division protease FtsH